MTLMQRVRRVMGTVVAVTVPADREDVVEPAFDRLEWVDRTFSVYRPDSQISRIGHRDLAAADAHPLVQRVLDECEQLEQATNGWFRPRAPERGRPLDPSAFVKGWAVDLVIDDFIGAGVVSGFVSAGGDVAAIGARPDGSPWRAGVHSPDESQMAAVVGIVDSAIATSGGYERGDHIWGQDGSSLFGVSVVGPSLGTADALATALYADGGTDLSWFEEFELYGCVIVYEDASVRLSPGMKHRLVA
jgi:thiamine biosynthesis lipoprotein